MALICHSESMTRAFQWKAGEQVNAPGKHELAGLLCMGAGGRSFPFSWGQRGFPKMCAQETMNKYLTATDAHIASFLTRDDLQQKQAELFIMHDEDALKIRPYLIELIKALPAHDGNPKHQRIVFWFR
jgi:hypothetical protein